MGNTPPGRSPRGTGYPPTVGRGMTALEWYPAFEWFFRALTRMVKFGYRAAQVLVRALGKRVDRRPLSIS